VKMEKLIDFCPTCRCNREYVFKTKKRHTHNIRGIPGDFDFYITIAQCTTCGNEMFIPGLIDRNIAEMTKQYREQFKKDMLPSDKH